MKALLLSLLLAGPALAQSEDICLQIFDNTKFCGSQIGWQPLDPQPIPHMKTFRNQEFNFSVSHQSNHGQSVNNILYDSAIRGLLHEIDQRHDTPPGTHQAAFVELVYKDDIEGRRLAVISEFDDTPISIVMDIYYSRRQVWIAQTFHVGPIKMRRLKKVHDFAVKELIFDP